MKLSEHKDLKTAITDLPIKEKDKLLLRLIAKDKVLTEHLHYKLLESESDLEDRKEKIKTDVSEQVPELKKLNAKEALVKVRKMITSVNHFYKVTKDPIGEVELKLFILNIIPFDYRKSIFGYRDYMILFSSFYIKTAAITINKYKKLHEDLQFDLSESLNNLLDKIYSSKLAAAAEASNLPKELS
ncbi:hypothetical protein ASE92_19920 [Pedobacter sp. Leaf41]|jgi:hypothetical protein|uniref:hypothetical protein n=1 Tax=Pedobacter sp. Leaf41 TaxID=1736218 RepID=UPI0007024707|nr:hypothetical protein [Pedobacter sp. Leaf41]KQN28627.1 hypothetical protein ASE92_19920 [Pedobacter sp. Leaf41]RZK68001.1 MAG: hypothetical protein EOO95_01140 [Pedobacter sp.]